MREALEAAGVEIESAELTMEPKNTVEVGGTDARALLGLIEALDEHDDVERRPRQLRHSRGGARGDRG